jgi:hypothetical protein
MADAGIDFSWQWSQERDFIKGNVEQDSSLDAGSFPNDICYVETLNEYTPPVTNPPGQSDLPFGIVRIRATGAARILKTIIVKYEQVKEYPLDVIKHQGLTNVSDGTVRGWFETATNDIFLLDEYPRGASIKDRYNDDRDVNCPIALLLDRFAEFSDQNVAAQGTFDEVNTEQEWNDIRALWAIPVWMGPNGQIDYRSFDIIMVKELRGGQVLGVTKRSPGYGVYDVYILMGTNYGNGVTKTLAHENGHYIGGLEDKYHCPICRKTFGRCTCVCTNCGRVRKDCWCGALTTLPAMVNDPAFPNNLMWTGPDEHALKIGQVTKMK